MIRFSDFFILFSAKTVKQVFPLSGIMLNGG